MGLELGIQGTTGRAGRVVASLLLVVFTLVGGGVFALLVVEAVQELAVYRWTEVPCRIESSRVVESDSDDAPYRLEIRYRYRADGVEHTGDGVARTTPTSSSYDRLRDRALAYPAGSESTCRVDPDRPDRSVLQASLPWILLAAPLPLIFVAIGVMGLIMLWRGGRRRQEPLTAEATRGRRLATWVPIVLGAVFTLVGGILFVTLGVMPWTRTLRAASWEPTPCTVVASRVRSHDSDDGTTYSVDILYEFRVDGRPWRSNRFDFVPGSSSGYDGKRAIVDRYPEGSAATCYVDPDDPRRSVLERGFSLRHLLGLVPLAFFVPGLGILAWGLGRRRNRAPMRPATARTPTRMPADARYRAAVPSISDGPQAAAEAPPVGPAELHPRYSPLTKIGCATGLALFWNGIVSVFAYQAVSGWIEGDPDWFLTLFLIPFVLIGLALIGSIVYFLLAAFNPRPVLTVSEGAPRLGERLEVGWRLEGAVRRLRRLEITLEAREEATYRRGTDTHTDRRVFARGRIASTEHSVEMRQGSGSIELPADLVASFDGGSNKVVWCLRVAGDVPRWPDVADEFPLVVRPARRGGSR